MDNLLSILYVLCFAIIISLANGKRCNEVLCASVVSKCMLTQSCKCDISMDQKKCTCCVDCAKCLGRYYMRCCSCLDMCGVGPFDGDTNDSQIGDFAHPFVELFAAITQAKDPMAVEGIVISYPADIAIDELANRLQKLNYLKESHRHDRLLPMPSMGVNCTVVYLAQCHSSAKCKEQCQLIGSGSYRFFFNGCCECIGPACLNYGINESRCPKCSKFDDDFYNFEYLSDDAGISNDIQDYEKEP